MAVPTALFALSASFALAKTGRDAAFLAADGLRVLPALYATVALVSVPFGMVTLALMRRLGGRRTHAWMSLATAVSLCALAVRPPVDRGLLSVLAYVAVPLTYGVLFSMTWLAVPSSLVAADGRLHPRALLIAAAAALAGGTSGGVIAASFGRLASVSWMFWVACALVASNAVLLLVAPCRPVSVGPPATAGSVTASPAPAVPLLVAVAGLTAIVGIFVEYQFYAAVSEAPETAGRTSRLAALHMGVNGTALAGLLVTPWLHRRAGVGGALALLPAAMAAGAAGLWLGGLAPSRALLRATEGGLKASIHRVSWEQVLLLLPATSRPRVKMLLDGMTTRLAEGSAGLLLWGLVGAGVTPRGITGTLVLLAAIWLTLASQLWRTTAHLPPGPADLSRLPDS